jgi:hypothetical protein
MSADEPTTAPELLPAPEGAPEPDSAPPAAEATEPKPKRKRAPRNSGNPPGRKTSKALRAERVESQLIALGMSLSGLGVVTGQPAVMADGAAVAEHATNIAQSFAELAETNPRVAKFLDGAVGGSAWFGVALALGGLAQSVATNHGLFGELEPAPAEPSTGAEPTPAPGSMFAGLAQVLDQS